MVQGYDPSKFQAVALDVYNGSTSQVRSFKQQTGISYPICLNASNTGNAYGVANDFSVIVDQDGVIRYIERGFSRTEVENKIDELLTASDIREPGTNVPEKFRLYPNFPNPFNATTRMTFDLPQTSKVLLNVYDLNGRIISRQDRGRYSSGHHSIRFEADDLASGVYLIEFIAGSYRDVNKIILMK